MLDSKIIKIREDAAWVVFFHGFGGSSDTWQKQVDAYSQRYNLMLLDFHNNNSDENEPISIVGFCVQIAETMQYHGVEHANIVSVSSGSLIAMAFAALYPDKVSAMVMAGGIISFNIRTSFLIETALLLRNIVSYMQLYKFFAYIIMPRKNHKKSREIFVREAKKLGHREFCRWLNYTHLLKDIKPFKAMINNFSRSIPMLYVMGSEDYLFKSAIIKDAATMKNTSVEIITNCGHVCCIENPSVFNQLSLGFLAEKDNSTISYL